MKKLLLFLLIAPLFAFSQQETKREYYKSGRILSIINYTDGVREGSCRYFHDFGAWAIKSSMSYKNGKLIGSSKTYFKNGQVEHEGNYKYTEKGVYSRKEGIWKTYYESGQLRMESVIVNGIQGDWKSYDKYGKLQPVMEGGC
jgi:antitoxin component YwqK of YwqJK toxin-antitoxin module